MRILKIWESRMHIPFHFLFITISIYVFTAEVKTHVENLVHNDQRLPKNLNGSNCTRIGLEMRLETLIFCCMNRFGTKHGLVEVKSVAQML